MRPNQITNEHSFRDYGNRTRFADAPGSNVAPGRHAISPKADPSTGLKVNTARANFGRLQALNAHLNTLAKWIRNSDSVMQEIGGFLEEMGKSLDAVAKSYPPFPPGSEERVKYLESYTGLRAQIDQLTMPPRDGAVQGGLAKPEELDIPELSLEASDEEVLGALEKVGKSREMLEIKRNELAEDVEKLKRQSDFKLVWKKTYPSYGEELKAAEEAEEFLADKTSADVKYSLNAHQGLTLTETQTTLAQFLG